MGLSASKAIVGASLALLLCGSGTSARADAIPYPTAGVLNPVVYTFTAMATGDIIAYFAGSTASFENTLGLNVNGVSTGVFGLDNKSTPLGGSLDLGHANAGDVLTFVLRIGGVVRRIFQSGFECGIRWRHRNPAYLFDTLYCKPHHPLNTSGDLCIF